MSALKDRRLEANLSIAELARRASVDVGTVKRAETGFPVQEVKAVAIARVISQTLGVNLSAGDLEIVIYS